MTSQQEQEQRVMVRLHTVGVSRTNQDGKSAQILHEISFSALQGEITVIVGPSGSGKSTLLRLLNRLEEPSEGSILLNGVDIRELDPLAVRRRVAMVLQKPFMFEGTVLFNVQQPFRYRAVPAPDGGSREIARALDLVGLPTKLLQRDARTLSGGEQQRVSLARALISSPQVLLLDEPTSALDRPSSDRFALILRDICRLERLAVLLVTHDLRLAGQCADLLIYLEGGKIIEEGKGAELLSRPCSEAFRRFLAEPKEGEE